MSEYINNSVRRKETLKRLVRELHGGADLKEVQAEFNRTFQDVSPVEIAGMEYLAGTRP